MNRIVTCLTASIFSIVIGGSAIAVELPYTGNGDPLGLTSSKCSPRATKVPYTGLGDPDDLI